MADKKFSDMTAKTVVDSVSDKVGGLDVSEAAADQNITFTIEALLDRKVTTLTIASSAVTPNMDNGRKHKVTLTEAITVNAPTGLIVDGDLLQMSFIQDGTGGWGVTLNAIFSEGDDVAFSSLTTVASTTSHALWRYNSARS